MMSKTTAFIFFGIILIGIGISLFTLKGCGNKRASIQAPEEMVGVGGSDAAPDAKVKGSSETVPEAPELPKTAEMVKEQEAAAMKEAKPEPVAVPEPVKGPFKTPQAAMSALAAPIQEKNYEAFAALVNEGGIAESIEAEVKKLIESPSLQLDPEKPVVEISKSVGSHRWAFNFIPVAGEPMRQQLYADLSEGDDKNLEIAKVALPIVVTDQTKGEPGSSAAEAPSDAVMLSDTAAGEADALTVAHAFSKAVMQRDFKTARELADPVSVTDERVAALMIAIEEGAFHLQEERPLVVTLDRDDITWVLARVTSEAVTSEFAVELSQVDKTWKVNGLTFSKVLSALSEAAGGGDVAYSPIVEDPAGGDSLVLYFEFDEDGLTPRVQRQLAIVAGILSQSDERVIRINGHADALGSEDYNVILSDRRAEAIRQALIEMGVKPSQVVTEAFGAAKPRKPNFLPDGSDNPSGRSQNRRAEVYLDF